METKLENCICPECKQDYNGLSVDSSIELSVSIIHCAECGFRVEGNICEEDLTEKLLQVYNQNQARN